MLALACTLALTPCVADGHCQWHLCAQAAQPADAAVIVEASSLAAPTLDSDLAPEQAAHIEAEEVRRTLEAEIERLADGEHRFADALDDGTPIAVTLRVRGDLDAYEVSLTDATVTRQRDGAPVDLGGSKSRCPATDAST